MFRLKAYLYNDQDTLEEKAKQKAETVKFSKPRHDSNVDGRAVDTDDEFISFAEAKVDELWNLEDLGCVTIQNILHC